MIRKEHLIIDGIQKIVDLKASLNKGLSDELKQAYTNTISVPRPLVEYQVIKNPYWLAGFSSGEGSFQLNLTKSSSNKIGYRVELRFQITQHVRDEPLFNTFVSYLACGKIFKRPDGKAVDFIVTKFSDIDEKIIPFFDNYSTIGVKAWDFADWCKAAVLIGNKATLL